MKKKKEQRAGMRRSVGVVLVLVCRSRRSRRRSRRRRRRRRRRLAGRVGVGEAESFNESIARTRREMSS